MSGIIEGFQVVVFLFLHISMFLESWPIPLFSYVLLVCNHTSRTNAQVVIFLFTIIFMFLYSCMIILLYLPSLVCTADIDPSFKYPFVKCLKMFIFSRGISMDYLFYASNV